MPLEQQRPEQVPPYQEILELIQKLTASWKPSDFSPVREVHFFTPRDRKTVGIAYFADERTRVETQEGLVAAVDICGPSEGKDISHHYEFYANSRVLHRMTHLERLPKQFTSADIAALEASKDESDRRQKEMGLDQVGETELRDLILLLQSLSEADRVEAEEPDPDDPIARGFLNEPDEDDDR